MHPQLRPLPHDPRSTLSTRDAHAHTHTHTRPAACSRMTLRGFASFDMSSMPAVRPGFGLGILDPCDSRSAPLGAAGEDVLIPQGVGVDQQRVGRLGQRSCGVFVWSIPKCGVFVWSIPKCGSTLSEQGVAFGSGSGWPPGPNLTGGVGPDLTEGLGKKGTLSTPERAARSIYC
eukprot:359951-Chlamydomonas_euryale.AAC.1